MDSAQLDTAPKRKLQGCQSEDNDVPPVKKVTTDEADKFCVGLLDLSDDVLLHILQHCDPRDLKALAFTCQRFGSLIEDRTLWCHVDTRSQPVGKSRLNWYLSHGLNGGTQSLSITGYAREASGCLGRVNGKRPVCKKKDKYDKPAHTEFKPSTSESKLSTSESKPSTSESKPSTSKACAEEHPKAKSEAVKKNAKTDDVKGSTSAASDRQSTSSDTSDRQSFPSRQPAHLFIKGCSSQQLPRFCASPSWPDGLDDDEDTIPKSSKNGTCPGPQFTLSPLLLNQLCTQCPKLTELRLEYCNINCKTTPITHFPYKLKLLSMRGSRCYNLPTNKTYLSMIEGHLKLLEHLDVSECDWFVPSTLLPVSKLVQLKTLQAQNCKMLSEFVAYASLTTRYGFKHLKVLDLRGSPVGDSEVSGFGWLPELEELYLEAAKQKKDQNNTHTHFRDDPIVRVSELEDWETQEPSYFLRRTREIPEPDENNPDHFISEVTDDIYCAAQNENCLNSLNVIERITVHRGGNQGSQRNNNSVIYRICTRRPRARRNSRNDENAESLKRGNESKERSPPKQQKLDFGVNEGASTSRGNEANQSYIKFSRNQTPVLVSHMDNDTDEIRELHLNIENKNEIRKNEDSGKNDKRNEVDNKNEYVSDEKDKNDEGDPEEADERQENENDMNYERRLHLLYVNVRRPQQPILRMFVENERPTVRARDAPEEPPLPEPAAELRADVFRQRFMRMQEQGAVEPGAPDMFHHRFMRMPFLNNLFYGPPTVTHLDTASLITDFSVHCFGRSESEDVNYYHIGQNGAIQRGLPPDERSSSRPTKSRLRVLVCRGFKGVTNSSLNHLATAAPLLRYLDFTNTKVTDSGIECFKNLRPDCEVLYTNN